jgi:hypothetical protein
MARARVDGKGGFALAVVVFLLFAIGVSAAAAYQVVFLEHRLSGLSMDADRAQVVAEAGLQRFIGDAVSGIPGDTAYFIDDGEAQVSSRRVVYVGPWEELHRVHSVGRVTDPRYFDAPAIREVARYARLRAPPMEVLAPLVTTAGEVNVAPGFMVDGEDAPAPPCRQRDDGWVPWYDIVAAGPIVGVITAAALWGWLPSIVWLMIGVSFIGWVSDYTAIVLAVSNDGNSLSAVAHRLLAPRVRTILFVFIF